MRSTLLWGLGNALLLTAAGAAASQDATSLLSKDAPKGYLAPADLPDSLALLPPPPEAGSAAMARDEAASKATQRPAGSPRWQLAARDADLHFPQAAQTFTCATGIKIDPQTTPALYRLIGRSTLDIGLSTYKAKNHYKRVRPFVAHGNTTCLPRDEQVLRTDGSYPSGHSALGWGWALLLAEIMPARADAILQRGRDFGTSRLVCNAHWQSDVDAGRLMASAAVARLHADPAFRDDLAKARAEAGRIPAAQDASCTAESSALAE